MCEDDRKGIHFKMDRQKAIDMKVYCAKNEIEQTEFIEEAISEKLEKMEE